jgi:hypothetical protein
LPDGSEVRESCVSAVGADDRNYSSRSNRYIRPLCYGHLLSGTKSINQGYATVCPFAECSERLRRTPDPSIQTSWTSRGAITDLNRQTWPIGARTRSFKIATHFPVIDRIYMCSGYAGLAYHAGPAQSVGMDECCSSLASSRCKSPITRTELCGRRTVLF